METDRIRVSSGVADLDRILEGLFIGDNVVWYDDAGSLASVFCLRFIEATQSQNKPLVYLSFDRSPRNLLEKLGPLAAHGQMTILDCFTCGKGASSEVFLRFYDNPETSWPCSILRIDDPKNVSTVMDALYGIHEKMTGEVHFVFESLTGMQELWGGEEQIVQFYAHSCPRLYELRTIAYWLIEKRAHSPQLRAKINQIAQVAIELSVRRGKTALTVLKADRRSPETQNKIHHYYARELEVTFDDPRKDWGGSELGRRLKALRVKQGLSQTELAKLVGVTPSTISQVESHLIYPSLPALFKMAEILSVDVGAFFRDSAKPASPVVFPAAGAVEVKFPNLPKKAVAGKLLTPPDSESRTEAFLIEIPARKTLPSHFFIHKGEEIGYLLSGRLQMKLREEILQVGAGDLVLLTSEIPAQWKNPGPGMARLLWLKMNSPGAPL